VNGVTKIPNATGGWLSNEDGQKQALAEPDQTGNKLGKLGLSIAPASSIKGAGERGLVVTDVEADGPAAAAGIEPGDVILQIGNRDVASANDVRQALSDVSASGRKKALTLVKRGNDQHYLVLPAKASPSCPGRQHWPVRCAALFLEP
jgi:serine protease Do